MSNISEIIQIELDRLERIFLLNNFTLIKKQDNFRNITEEYDDEHINKKITLKEVFSNREYIFKNDKFSIYFQYNNTRFTTDKRYIMITRVFDGTVNNMVNLCIFSFDDLSKELSNINHFLISTQVFVKSYKTLIGENNECTNNSTNETIK